MRILYAVVSLVVLQLACPGAGAGGVTGSPDSIKVSDFAGRDVTLPAPARRIIALAPHIVENTFSAGAGERLVGVVSYSDFPPAAAKLPEVGSYQAWSLEAIVAQRPDLVLVWASGNGKDSLAMLQRLGIASYVSEPRRLEDIARTIRDIGVLAGTSEQAETEASRIEQGLEELRARRGHRADVSVFYQVWNQPLQTVNGEHLISDVIDLCGGRNIFAQERAIAPRVNIESVLARDPQVIVASGMDSARPEWLDDWLQYPSMRAVRDGNLFFVHPDLLQRPTARILQGARQLCRHLDSVTRPAVR